MTFASPKLTAANTAAASAFAVLQTTKADTRRQQRLGTMTKEEGAAARLSAEKRFDRYARAAFCALVDHMVGRAVL